MSLARDLIELMAKHDLLRPGKRGINIDKLRDYGASSDTVFDLMHQAGVGEVTVSFGVSEKSNVREVGKWLIGESKNRENARRGKGK